MWFLTARYPVISSHSLPTLLEPEPLFLPNSLWMPWKVQCESCHIFCCINPCSPCISMWSLSAVLSVAVRSPWSSHGSCLDSLVMPFGRLFSMSGGHMTVVRYLIWNFFDSHIAVIRNLVRNCFGIPICTCSAWIRLVWLIFFSPAYLQVTGRPSYAEWAYRLRWRGALAGSPPGVLVESSVGVLPSLD